MPELLFRLSYHLTSMVAELQNMFLYVVFGMNRACNFKNPKLLVLVLDTALTQIQQGFN